MRITVSIDDHLLVEAKKRAGTSGRTLSAVLEETLRESLARRKVHAKAKRILLLTVNGNGLRRGVDLDSRAALLDLLGE